MAFLTNDGDVLVTARGDQLRLWSTVSFCLFPRNVEKVAKNKKQKNEEEEKKQKEKEETDERKREREK